MNCSLFNVQDCAPHSRRLESGEALIAIEDVMRPWFAVGVLSFVHAFMHTLLNLLKVVSLKTFAIIRNNLTFWCLADIQIAHKPIELTTNHVKSYR